MTMPSLAALATTRHSFSTYGSDVPCPCVLDTDNMATIMGGVEDTYGEEHAIEVVRERGPWGATAGQ